MEVNFKGGISGYIDISHMEMNMHHSKDVCNPIPWLKYAELCRVSLSIPVYYQVCQESIFTGGRAVFLLSCQFEFTPEAREFAKRVISSQEAKLNIPVRLIHTTRSVGNSSAVYSCDAVEPQTGVVLMNMGLNVVLVDKQSRRPVPFPAKFRAFVNSHNAPPYNFSKEPMRTPPSEVTLFKWGRSIQFTDVDQNQHANNTAYVILALECLGAALAEGYSIVLPDELHLCMIKRGLFTIVNETRLGQMVDVEMWQSADDLFHFVMSNGEKRVAFVTLSYMQ